MSADELIPDRNIPSGIEVAPGVRIPESGMRLQYSRGSGPGGQNVNKVNTKAELWIAIAAVVGLTDRAKDRLATLAGHRLTASGEIHIASDTRRTQEANRAELFERLRELIITAKHEPKRRKKTRPSRASKQRRLDSKKRRGDVKAKRRFSDE